MVDVKMYMIRGVSITDAWHTYSRYQTTCTCERWYVCEPTWERAEFRDVPDSADGVRAAVGSGTRTE
jgi:hypothetical protein